MNLIQASLQSILPPNRKTTSGGWLSFNAPCCHHKGERLDDKQRGGVKFEKDGFVYHCFNCGFAAGWQPGKLLSNNTKNLFLYLGMPFDDLQRIGLKVRGIKDDLATESNTFFSLELKDINLPEDTLPISEWIKLGCNEPELISCITYIQGRGLTLDDYNWHWSATNGYRDRVLIPFYNQTHIVGYTGRKIVDGKPKYLTHSQNGYVFNIDAQTYDRAYVIVVEGQFDAIASDGVAIMHNEPSETQCFRINSLGKEVIVVPDRDAPGAKMLAAAVEHGWSMSLPPWGEEIKDVAKAVEVHGKAYTLAAILHYKESNKTKIEIKKKELERLHDNKT